MPARLQTVTVTLVSVSGDTVKTTVGSTTHKGLSAGETFATNFQVYAIFNESCAGFLYGDTSFALCEGKTATLDNLDAGARGRVVPSGAARPRRGRIRRHAALADRR